MKRAIDDDVTVIDFAAHFYPPEVEHLGGLRGSHEHAGHDRMSDTDVVFDEMETGGIDAMVLSNPWFMNHDDADEAAEANDALYEYVDAHEEFYGLSSLPMAAGGATAAEEFERTLEMGFHGAGVNETDVGLTDEEMEPVLEVADDHGAPLFIHIPHLGSVQYRLNAIYGREHAQQRSISTVIHAGLYDRYDDLQIVWHHFGGNIAAMLGRAHLQIDPGRWPDQDDMKSFAEFKAELEERVLVDSSGFFGYTAPIRIALEEFPASQILFGTDYPWEPRDGEELGWLADAVLESASGPDARRILGENALDVMVNV